MMKIFKYSILNIITFLIAFSAISQPPISMAEKEINEVVVMARQEKSISMKDIDVAKYDSKKLISVLKKFNNDPSPNVRFAVQTIQFKIGQLSNDKNVRKEITKKLVKDCIDPDPLVRQQAVNRLLSFNSADFSDDTKKQIAEIVNQREVSSEILLVAGLANVETLSSKLITLKKGINKGKVGWYTTPAWYASLALARMGDQEQTRYVIALVESEKDPVLKVTRLLRDIAFIRQREGVNLLLKYLETSERLPSVKTTVEGLGYNQYALDLLTQIIENFPIKMKGVGYTEAEISLAKRWMKNNPDYRILK